MEKKLNVAIVGVTGYTGIELYRILKIHPNVSISWVTSRQHAGKKIKEAVPEFLDDDFVISEFQSKRLDGVDFLFLAMPHGEVHSKISDYLVNPNLKIIDLSADFRIQDPQIYLRYYGYDHQAKSTLSSFSYGIPELFRDNIRHKTHCANPGCYSTASILGLYPLKKNGLLEGSSIVIDAKSGVSGAGKSLKESFLFCEANEGVSAYGTFYHRHTAEIEQAIEKNVFFSPHLVPMNRGILASIYIDNVRHVSQYELEEQFKKVYHNEPFIFVDAAIHAPSTKWVMGTNRCLIVPKVFEKSGKIVVFSMIDNLMKGASGQAVQNMNVMAGIEETMGLN